MRIKRSINKLLSLFGIGIHRIQRNENGKLIPKYFKWLQNYNIDTVLDIGANEGQFASEISIIFPNATIHSVEALPDVFEKLKLNFKNNPKIIPYLNAVGSQIGKLDFNRNEFTQSSSFLKINSLHTESFSNTSTTKKVELEVTTLDILFKNLKSDASILLKIDVQGFEVEVLKGANELLKKVRLIKIEISFNTLYQNQPLFDELYMELKNNGFRLVGISHILEHPHTGLPLQADAYFEKITK